MSAEKKMYMYIYIYMMVSNKHVIERMVVIGPRAPQAIQVEVSGSQGPRCRIHEAQFRW